jgi:hypothetical protein
MSTEREYVCDDCGDYWEAGDMLIPGYLMDDRAVDAATALAASEARAAALESVGQRMHDLLDNENAGMNARYEENQPVCIWCAEKGYDGDGLRHHDNCVLVAWRTLTPTSSPATDEAQGEA